MTDKVRSTHKTFRHLAEGRRLPSEYEIATTGLLYYLPQGFEVPTPLKAWYDRYQAGSSLKGADWEQFHDPRESTYARWVELQDRQETQLDGLLDAMDTAYDSALPPAWIETWEWAFGPLRYPLHGLQMVAAYVGSMAPAGRIVVPALFQAGDEMRRIQRAAYRLAQLRVNRPGFGDRSLKLWREDAAWQPLRRLVERLLVTYDWGEALIALNLCVKPAVDGLFFAHAAATARGQRDPLWAEVLGSLHQDGLWHRAWATELVTVAIAADRANADVIRGWVDRWLPPAREAAEAFGRLSDSPPEFSWLDATPIRVPPSTGGSAR